MTETHLERIIREFPHITDLNYQVGKILHDGQFIKGYNYTHTSALKEVAEYFNIDEAVIEVVDHASGGKMFFAMDHAMGPLGGLSARHDDVKGTILYGRLWISTSAGSLK
jgi:hypothetical protein